jgi:hypothetical protein
MKNFNPRGKNELESLKEPDVDLDGITEQKGTT